MAQQLLQPSVTEFIDLVSQWGATDLNLEEVQLLEGSSLVGVPLRDTPIRKEMDVIVVGARDTLIVLGRRDNLRRLARMAAGKGGGKA